MCGIAGILTFEPASASGIEARAQQMVAALAHRGPDSRGTWSGTTQSGTAVALGHSRLAIIDLSETGRQPMRRGQSVLTCNGEIYNYRELRAELGDRGQ